MEWYDPKWHSSNSTKSYAYTAKVSSEPESCREVMILDDTLIVFGINVSDNYVHVIMLIMIEWLKRVVNSRREIVIFVSNQENHVKIIFSVFVYFS